MLSWLIYGMVYLGSVLMVYNIYGFVRFSRSARSNGSLGSDSRVMYVPITLLVLFLLGYLVVGIFGNPDIIVSGILFGGSIFVFIMYRTLERVTEKVIENERLKADLTAAEQSNRAKTDFLASMSHEMRTPLNVILGLDEIALKDPDVPQKTREQLQKIGLSAHHLLDIINNILELNEIESGEYTVLSEEFSLRGSIDQVNAIIQTLCQRKGLEYVTDLDDNMASAYIGDETHLRQVLLSVLEDAVKYTDPPGTVYFGVEAKKVSNESHALTFVVSDTGVGIDEDFIPKVFEPFSREDSSSTSRFGGTGMSLAVSKRVLDGMGGTIEVESKKHVGTTFTIRIALPVVPEPATAVAPGPAPPNPAPSDPAAPAPPDPAPSDLAAPAPPDPAPSDLAAPVPPDPAPSDSPAFSLEGRRILIVEDLEENAEIVADLLELEGMQSERAENGQVAVQMIADAPPWHYDAILMDLRMPIMNGLDAARGIRALDRADAQAIPIIALTANAFESDVRQSLDAGMNAHLAKPVDVDLLYDTLEELIQKTVR